MKSTVFIVVCLFFCLSANAFNSGELIKKGWAELIKDNDSEAIKLFYAAYEEAEKNGDTEFKALALLHLGISTYGSSLHNGMKYAMQSLEEFKKSQKSNPRQAEIGRCKCLQLISTIKAREGKFRESIGLSQEALRGFDSGADSTGYRGIIYSSLGQVYARLNMPDSSEYFHRLALKEREMTNDKVYLSSSYIKVADIELLKKNASASKSMYEKGLQLSESAENRQAMVLALIGLSKWYIIFENNFEKSDNLLSRAEHIALSLSDKSFLLSVLHKQKENHFLNGDYQTSLAISEKILNYKDSLTNWEETKLTQSMETQFDIAEKDRKLVLAQKENAIAQLTNSLLIGTVLFLAFIIFGIVAFYKKIGKRDRELLETKEELLAATEMQKKLSEQKMQNEIEFKESQLSAITIQMLQKNELLNELKEKIESSQSNSNQAIDKIISKGLVQEQEWNDFNRSFESVNKNFYTRIKQQYPDISPNELKICALMKMNLNSKEMAGILNISPDSVKTARYRLRKKLQLQTEDNLTDFILSL